MVLLRRFRILLGRWIGGTALFPNNFCDLIDSDDIKHVHQLIRRISKCLIVHDQIKSEMEKRAYKMFPKKSPRNMTSSERRV